MKHLREKYENACNECIKNFRRGFITTEELNKCLDDVWEEYQTIISNMHDYHSDYIKALAEFGDKITY